MKFEIIFCTDNVEYESIINVLTILYNVSGYLTKADGFYKEDDSIVKEIFYKYQGSFIKKDFPGDYGQTIWKAKVHNLAKELKRIFNQKEVWIDFIESETVQI